MGAEDAAKSFERPSYVLSTAPLRMLGDVDKMGNRRDSITKGEGLYHSAKQSCESEDPVKYLCKALANVIAG